VAAFLDGPAQTLLWVLALSTDFAGPYVFGVRGFRVSPGHFAERFSLIVIIALGESIVAIGTGLQGVLDAGTIAAALLGLVLAFGIWWAYFDVVAVVAERHFREAQGMRRLRIARDSYSYLHLPMIAGVLLVALGLKKVLEYVGDASDHTLSDPLATVPLVAMYAGVSLYLFAHVAFRWRNVHSVNVQRVVAGFVVLLLIWPASDLPALWALTLLTAATCALIAFEVWRFGELREQIRHDESVEVSHLRRDRS